MSELRRCPQCDAEIPANSPIGLCPRCLLKASADSQSAAASAEPGPTKLTPPASGFVPPTVEELAPLFPQLEILELLGKGGMGAVYKARQPGLDRLVAVKILPPEISHDPAFAERFQREARALARLSHPHIVAVYDFGQTLDVGWPPSAVPNDDGNWDGRGRPSYYIVMEFVDGANLRQAIKAGKLASAESLAIVPQICEALQFAHDEGIVHRDIKPENILIDKRGRVKIADFGLAKLLGQDASDHSLTATHQVMGTLRYMAPEQMQGSREVDHRADIYSLGVVFYELLTGELPMGRFAPPSKKVQVDVRLDEVVLRALEQNPEQRYQHASEVKTDVESVQSGERPVFASGQACGLPGESRETIAAYERQALDACERLLTSERRERIHAGLAEDEHLIWAARIGVASTWRYAGRMALTLIGILAGFFVGSGGLRELARTGWDIGSFVSSLVGVAFVLAIGVAALLAIGRRERVFYTLTNRRAIVWNFDRWGTVSAQSYGPTQLASAERIENRNGSGSLIFEKASSYFSAARGFKDIDDVREVHELIRRVILNQPAPRGLTTRKQPSLARSKSEKGAANEPRLVQGPADCLLLAAGVALVTACGVAIWLASRGHLASSLVRGNLTAASITLGIYCVLIGVAGLLLRQLRARLFVLLVVVVVGLFLPAVIALNVVMEFRNIPDWPVAIPLWLGVPAALWVVVRLFRDDDLRAFETAAEQRAAMGKKGTGLVPLTGNVGGTPLTQIRFSIDDSRDVARQAVFHFSSLGYRPIEQRPDICVFQRGRKWAGLWETDIRGIQTILTVRTAPADAGHQWVSCDWSVRTLGTWITRKDIAILEAEGRGLESLLGGGTTGVSTSSAQGGEQPDGIPQTHLESTPARRPKLVPVLAAFNLLGAIVLMLVCAMEEPAAFSPSVAPVWQVWEKVDAVLGFTMAAGLFAASIGLFLWKPWARKLTLGVCVFGLASFVFDAPYLARFAIPDLYAEIQHTVAEDGIEPDAREFVSMMTVVVLVGGVMVVGLAWLIGQLIYFTRPRVVAAFEFFSAPVSRTRSRKPDDETTDERNPTNGLARISLWAAISGVVLPALLLIGGTVLSGGVSIPDGFVVLCFLPGVGLELVAFACGLVTRETKSGKAGLIIACISLVLCPIPLTTPLRTIPTRVSTEERQPETITEGGALTRAEPAPSRTAPLTVTDRPSDDARIEGTWNYAASMRDGQITDPEDLKRWKVIFSQGQYTEQPDDRFEKGTYRLDPTKTPKTIDCLLNEGPHKGLVVAGIYELDGDNLKICWSKWGSLEHPYEFAATPGSERALVVLTREKAAGEN